MNDPFEILEHTADIGVRARGDTFEQLLSNLALGVESIALDCERVNPRIAYPIAVSGEDKESLVVNFLNECAAHCLYKSRSRRNGGGTTSPPKYLFPQLGHSGTSYGDNCIPNRPSAGNFIAGLRRSIPMTPPSRFSSIPSTQPIFKPR